MRPYFNTLRYKIQSLIFFVGLPPYSDIPTSACRRICMHPRQHAAVWNLVDNWLRHFQIRPFIGDYRKPSINPIRAWPVADFQHRINALAF